MYTFAGYGIGNPVIFWLLRILLLYIFVYCGRGISYDTPKRFNKYAWIAIVSYSLIEGLRWLRGADYPHYYDDLVTLFGQYPGGISGGLITPDPEPIYELWCYIFYYSGLPYWIAFVIYSGLLISGVLMVLKNIPKSAFWALPLFFILTISSSENLIRQYIAESFLLFSLYFYLSNNIKKMYISFILVFLIHYSGIIPIIVFLFFIYLPNRFLKRLENKYIVYVYLFIYIYVYFFWDTSQFSSFAEWISNFHLSENTKGASYIENSERWFSDEGSISNVLGTKANSISMINMLVKLLTYLSVIYYGFNLILRNHKYRIFFYMSYIAIIFKTIGGDIEMFARFYNWFVIFLPFLIGLYLTEYKINTHIKILLYIIYGCFFIWYSFLNSIFSVSIFGYGFIWNR